MTQQPPPLELAYESAVEDEPRGRRPKWVWVIIVVYLLLLATIVSLPLWIRLNDSGESGPLIAGTIIACTILLCGLGLLFTHVRIARRRPITRKSIWIPLAASGCLAAALFFGAGIAIMEWQKGFGDSYWFVPLLVGTGVVWVAWAVVFWLMAGRRDPTGVALWLHRILFAGSVAELLVAVPCHIVVRRRDECCAGFMTGAGIAIGCVVMLVSLGPGVAWLYYRRWEKITGRLNH